MANNEDAAFVGFQGYFRKLRSRNCALADVDARSVTRVLIGGDHDRRSQSGGSVAQTRGEIRSGGIFRGGRLCRHNDPPSDVIRDAIAVGILEHPPDGERICNAGLRTGGLRRLESKCAGYGQR